MSWVTDGAKELGITTADLVSLFTRTRVTQEVRAIEAKIVGVKADRDKVLLEFDAQLGELETARAEAQKRADEELGKA